MSQPVQIDPNALLAQAEMLRERLTQLQEAITVAERLRVNVLKAKDTINAASKQDELLVPADPDFNAILRVKPVEQDKVIVKIGEGVYAKLSIEEASETLEKRARAIAKQIELLTQELRQVASTLQTTEMILQQLALAAQKQMQQVSAQGKENNK